MSGDTGDREPDQPASDPNDPDRVTENDSPPPASATGDPDDATEGASARGGPGSASQGDESQTNTDDGLTWRQWALGWLSWQWLRDHAGLSTVVVTGVSALAYVVGLVYTGSFASQLGVSTAELGIDVRDQLLIAAVLLVVGVSFVAATACCFVVPALDLPRPLRLGLGTVLVVILVSVAWAAPCCSRRTAPTEPSCPMAPKWPA